MGFFSDAKATIDNYLASQNTQQPSAEGNSAQGSDEPYTQGVSIVHGTAKKQSPSNKYGLENTEASLRTGEDIILGDTDEYINGGVTETRYLGRTAGDYNNEDYFSNEDVSEDYSPLHVNLRTENGNNNNITTVGDMTVYYDKDGAIAEIALDSDFMVPGTGANYKKQTLRGKKAISDFFKSLSLDENTYLANGQEFGANSKRYMPANMFGSKGVLSGYNPENNITTPYTRRTIHNQYGAGRGVGDWEQYWHNQRINK